MAVSIGNDVLPAVVEIEVTQNAFLTADMFRVVLSLDKLERFVPAYGWKFWGSSDTESVVLNIAFWVLDPDSTADLPEAYTVKPFFVGYSDEIRVDPIKNEVDISGRDGSALLIETKTSEKFQNLTSSEIATNLATEHGLTPNVTATKITASRYYEAEHYRLADEISEWDLLTFLAQQEGFETYVEGTTLYFGPPVPDNADPYVVRWVPDTSQGDGGSPACNAVTLGMSRNLIVAKDVKIIVRSWNRKLGKTFKTERTATRHRSGSHGGGKPQIYTYNPPDLTQSQVDDYATAKIAEITKHQKEIAFSCGAEMTLGHRSIISLEGTGTEWDQVYHPDEIRRLQSFDRGFTTSVRAKNHSTRSTVSI